MNPDQKWWLLQTVTCPHCQAKDTVSDGDAFDNAITKYDQAHGPTNTDGWNAPVSKCSDCHKEFNILANVSLPEGLPKLVPLGDTPGSKPLPYRVDTSTPNWWLGAILVCPKCRTFDKFEDGSWVDVNLSTWNNDPEKFKDQTKTMCAECHHVYPSHLNLAFPVGHLSMKEGEDLSELF